MDTVFTIGIFLCFFFQFLLLVKKKPTTPDKILAVWMFLFGLHLFSFYIHHLGYWDIYPHLSGIHHPFPLLHGPFLYLFVLVSMRSDQNFRLGYYLHFMPAVLFYVYMIPYFMYTAEEKILVNRGEITDYVPFIYFSIMAFVISGIVYVILTFRLLYHYENLSKQNFSYSDNIDLNWLKIFMVGMGFSFFVAIVSIILESVFKIHFGFETDILFYLMMIVFIFVLGYFGIRHKNIFSDDLEQSNEVVQPKTISEYEKSGLKPELAEQYHDQLLRIMEESKPYLEPKLSLGRLAEQMGISANHLSQIINQYERKNFFDFVNYYRVEEFKKRVVDPAYKNYSILALALDSGFNSKSSFNQVFKNITGLTPSRYLSDKAAKYQAA